MNEPKIMEVVDNILYDCSTQTPISKISLMKLIPEIYSYKFDEDLLKETKVLDIGNSLSDYFYKYFKSKFQLSSLANDKMEATLKSVIKYSMNDHRVDTFRRLLAIGRNSYSGFIAEKYFILLQGKQII